MTHRLHLSFLILLLFSLISTQTTLDPYCIENSTPSKCSKCLKFFYLTNNTCTKVSPSCQTYNDLTGQCLTCVNGFTLKSGNCQGPVLGFDRRDENIASAEVHQMNKSIERVGVGAVSGNLVGLLPINTNLNVEIKPVLTTIGLEGNQTGQVNAVSFAPIPPQTVLLVHTEGQNAQNKLNSQNLLSNSQGEGFIFFGGYSEEVPHNPPSLPVLSSQDHSITTTSTTTTTTTSTSALPPTITLQDNPYGYPDGFMDPYCQQYDNNKLCIKCATRFFFNFNSGLCTPINPQCNTYNGEGQCLSCYPGYTLSQGNCTISTNQQSSDPNCKTFDSSNNCLDCYPSFILTNGKCRAVNPQCKDYNRAGGCTDCYAGYTLKDQQCIVTTQNVVNVQDLCKERGVNNLCVSCFGDNTVVNGICVPSLTLCQSIDSQSNCLSCYSGYTLTNGRCRISSTTDGCSRFDNSGKCLQCSKGFYIQNSTCKAVNPLCRSFNQITGGCESCYPGYSLLGGNCQVNRDISVGDPNCFQMNNGVCVICSNRFVKINGKCSPVNDYCNTYDNINGDCTSCYGGFVLRYGYCYKTIVGNQTGKQLSNTGNIQQNTTQIQTQTGPNSLQGPSPLSIGQQLFYEWLKKDTPEPQQGYLFSTDNTKAELLLDINTNSLPSKPAQSLLPLSPQTQNNITAPTQSNLRVDSSSSTPKLVPQSLSIATQTFLQLAPPIQPFRPSLLTNITTSTPSLPVDSYCVKYDTDKTTCTQCSDGWKLVEGHCLLGEIKKSQ